MPVEEQQARFERLLSPAVYEAAWRYASRLSANREDAEDLLQEALTRAFRKLHTLRDEAKFRSWLLCIMRHQFIRRRRRPSLATCQYELPVAAAGDNPAPGTELMVAALNQLPREQAEVLVLFYLEGFTIRETARVLGISPAAARQRLYRARGALRGRFQQLAHPKGATRGTTGTEGG
jgi:RNA polymerase sigma-70 factor (ECF subfamily)